MRNVIQGLRRISVQDAYEGKPILSLQEVLRHLGIEESDAFLSGVSGEAFIFTYKDAPIDEPQRDHWPHDIFAAAAEAVGASVTWTTGLPMEEVKRVVREQVDRGRPVLTYGLDTSQYHGFQIIVGYDYGKDVFLLQVADRYPGQGYVEVAIPERWVGAVPGPVFWAVNPLGLVAPGDPDARPDREQVVRQALGRAVGLWEQPSFPFGPFPAPPGTYYEASVDMASEEAPLGAAAYDTLEKEIREIPAVTFKMVWRLDAQLCKLSYNRRDAARFLREVGPLFSADEREQIEGAAVAFDRSVQQGSALMGCFWDKGLFDSGAATPEAAKEVIRGASSLILQLPDGMSAADVVAGTDWAVEQTPWGTTVVVDTPEGRDHAAGVVKELKANEGRGFALLRSVTGG